MIPLRIWRYSRSRRLADLANTLGTASSCRDTGEPVMAAARSCPSHIVALGAGPGPSQLEFASLENQVLQATVACDSGEATVRVLHPLLWPR